MKALIAWLRITRPPIVLISCFGAIVGGLNTSVYLNQGRIDLSFFQIVISLIASAFLAAGLMIHNDVTDLKSDRTNRPNKPIPSGIINEKAAYIVGLGMMILSIILTLFINIYQTGLLNWNCSIFTLVIVLFGLYYNHYGKYHGIIGNLTVALGVGSIPYWGTIAFYPNYLLIMAPFSFALFIQEVGREIMVNAGDITGDINAGFKTLPIKIGRKQSMYIALIFYILFIPLFPLPAIDYLNLGVPKIFGSLYLLGGSLLSFTLILTWILTYKVVIKNDEKEIWHAFELYERTGTRLMIIIFQIFLF